MPITKRTYQILIVDDHPMVREGLIARITSDAELTVCGEAEDVAGGLASFEAKRPDLVIVDLALKNGSGLDLIKQVRARDPKAKLLVISAYDESLYAERVLRAGALGYINKQECRENVVVAIRTVLDGRRYLSQKLLDRLVGQAVAGPEAAQEPITERLTDRELEVFQLIGQGRATREIAKQLHLSPHTVESHREKIKAKLSLKNAAELTQRATQWVLENR